MEITAFYSGQPKPLEQCLCDETRNGKKKSQRKYVRVCPMQTKNDNTVSSLQELWQSRQKKSLLGAINIRRESNRQPK